MSKLWRTRQCRTVLSAAPGATAARGVPAGNRRQSPSPHEWRKRRNSGTAGPKRSRNRTRVSMRRQRRQRLGTESERPVQTLEQVLLDKAFATPEQIAEAQAMQNRTGVSLGRCLVKLGSLDETQLVSALASQIGLPFIDLPHAEINDQAVFSVPAATCQRLAVIPVGYEGDNLVLAMAAPDNVFGIDDVRKVTGRRVIPAVALRAEVEAALQRYRFDPNNVTRYGYLFTDWLRPEGPDADTYRAFRATELTVATETAEPVPPQVEFEQPLTAKHSASTPKAMSAFRRNLNVVLGAAIALLIIAIAVSSLGHRTSGQGAQSKTAACASALALNNELIDRASSALVAGTDPLADPAYVAMKQTYETAKAACEG